jgi:DNA polymerase III delta prime subunit
MYEKKLKVIAEEALMTFAEIADNAKQQLTSVVSCSTDSFATGNTLTGGRAYQNLNNIGQKNREGWEALQREPAIARLLLENEEGQRRVVYIARKSSLSLPSGTQFASYGSPIGRLAELPVGDEASVTLQGRQQVFFLIEKTNLRPEISDGGWDSIHSQYRNVDGDVFSIDSLRALLCTADFDAGDELDRLLEQSAIGNGVHAGIRHQIRTAMGLRDQPILDHFQGEIFRLPLDSQLIILGPPGTGKTTTLIKRLGQKLDIENLDENERRLINITNKNIAHENSWLMFTPSELLRHYLKEAFSREQIPASDARIKTWIVYRNDIARNTLGILRTPNGGKFILKSQMDNLSEAVVFDPRVWYQSFSDFHDQRLRKQLKEGAIIIGQSTFDSDLLIIQGLLRMVDDLADRELINVYRDLAGQENEIKRLLDESKEVTDQLLKKERNQIFNRDKTIFDRLSKFLVQLQQDDTTDDEPDEEAEFDDDDTETTVAQSSGGIPSAVAIKAYLGALRSLARSIYRKRSLPKNSRSAKVVGWLGDALPTGEVLLEIGQRISYQNGLRRFVNASKRYVAEVPNSYRLFRKSLSDVTDFYVEVSANPLHLSCTELDAVVLLMLRNSRDLLSQSFVTKELEAARYESLRSVASLFRNQIMVDEATDFSMLQLACMESLTTLKGCSFFACGDFNQRITDTGIRNTEQIAWVSPRISAKKINLVYRQSRILNTFAGDLLKLLDGDLNTLGELPTESTHEGVKPVLLENAGEEEVAQWIAKRIHEVERAVGKMPTVAVLVNSEADVKPMANSLTACLEVVSLKAVACEEGKALGEDGDVRVFDIEHIKGLEFEAVFFVGVDQLAEQKPKLFDRYLYVGTTRAATYLGVVCYQTLPAKIQSLDSHFQSSW